MLARLYSVTLIGIEGIICEVEVDVASGGFEKSLIVGLPDTAVKESIERVRSAVINSGYKYPKTRSLINLAPADVKKIGPAFDLPIALGMLIGSNCLQNRGVNDYVVLGELALDGRVRPVNGVLSMAMTAAANGFKGMIVPLENAREAAVVEAHSHRRHSFSLASYPSRPPRLISNSFSRPRQTMKSTLPRSKDSRV
jgi:magnesium chelatase family protein